MCHRHGVVLATLASLVGASCGRVGFDRDEEVTVTFGAADDDEALALAVTASGTLLVGGRYRDTVDFGCATETAIGQSDAFLVELDPRLSCLRVWTAGGPGNDFIQDIAVRDDIVVGGEFQQTAQFGSAGEQVAAYSRDIFVAKLSPRLDPRWVRRLPGNDNDPGYGLIGRVGLDQTGAAYVFGRLWGSGLAFGWDGASQTFSDTGWGDAFLLRIAADGRYERADMFGGGGSEHAKSMLIDDDMTAYLGGIYRGSVDFDPGPGATVYTSGASHAGFLLRRNADQAVAWVIPNENGGWREYVAVAKAPSVGLAAVRNDVNAVGTSAIGVRTLMVDPSDGRELWSNLVLGDETVVMLASSLAADDEGNVYVAGSFGATVDFDPGPDEDLRTAAGSTDSFIQSYDPAGALRWTVTFGGVDADRIVGIVALAPDDVVVAGTYRAEVDFSSSEIPDRRQASGGADVFVRRIRR